MISQPQDKSRAAGAAFLFFCISLFLTAYSAKHPAISQYGQGLLNELIRPIQYLTTRSHEKVSGIWSGYFALVGVQKDNERYRMRLANLEQENAKLAEIKSENERLKKLLEIVEREKFEHIAATVIAYDPSSWVQAVTIDRGTSDGVEKGMAVIEGNGVVGQVVSATSHTARVMLIIDRASGVDGLIQESRARGLIDGTGSQRCEFNYVSESEEVQVGDKIVTSGLDAVFPKGLILGVVTAVNKSSDGLFKSIVVTPSVKFSRLENVLVLKSSERIPELEEPVPSPTPIVEKVKVVK